jgi:7-carboxy-7-deazaguanine synthase
MHGKNPVRKPEKGDGSELYVQEMFPTFQGECYYTGVPAVFIRLGGCNLTCNFCDTEFESFELKPISEILKKADELSRNTAGNKVRNLIVLTGGEPFRQPIAKLCEELLTESFKIQIESNGTIYREIPEAVEIVCSPKNPNNNAPKLRDDILQRCNALKFIISASEAGYQNVWDVGAEPYNIPIYLQPMDEHDEEKNKANLELVKKLAFENGYRISLQTHKIMNIA